MAVVRPARLLALSMLCLGLCLGCGKKDPRRPLSGTVTFQGKALDQGTITLLATTGQPGPVCGALIRQGRFDVSADQGVLPGTYRVTFSSGDPGKTVSPEEYGQGGNPPAVERIPAKFNTESDVTIEVKASGANKFEFAIP